MLSMLNKKYTLYVFELFYSSANNSVYSETDLHVIEFYICISSGAVRVHIYTWNVAKFTKQKFKICVRIEQKLINSNCIRFCSGATNNMLFNSLVLCNSRAGCILFTGESYSMNIRQFSISSAETYQQACAFLIVRTTTRWSTFLRTGTYTILQHLFSYVFWQEAQAFTTRRFDAPVSPVLREKKSEA
jgi:hypothetical protein